MMRRICLLSAILLLFGACSAAQYGGSNAEPPGWALSYQTTLEGCLGGAAGNYTLTLPTRSVLPLTGNTEGLQEYVGERVQVTGISTPIAHEPGSMSEGTQTQPTMDVHSFIALSGACSPTSNGIR
jgi:hypothetical protein